MHRTALFVALFAGTLALAPGLAGAQEDGGGLEAIVAETATTKAQHEALAGYYAEQAAAARRLAARHHAMHRAYLGSKSGNKEAFVNHCMRIAGEQEAIAKEYEGLAKLHRAEATATK